MNRKFVDFLLLCGLAIVLAFGIVVGLGFVLGGTAKAQTPIEAKEGNAVVCDTVEQHEQLARIIDDPGAELQQALNAVNEKAKSVVCAHMNFIYINRKNVAKVRVQGQNIDLAEVWIVAIKLEGNWAQLNKPHMQIAPFLNRDVEASLYRVK